MALGKELVGQGNAPVNYHMIPGGTLGKDLKNDTYHVSFNLVSFVDQETRDDKPEAGYLDHRVYSKQITEAQMTQIIIDLGLYDHVKTHESDNKPGEGLVFSDATDII